MTEQEPPSDDKEGKKSISHDKLFKALFQRFLPDLVQIAYPHVAATLDLSQFKLLDKELIPDFRKPGHTVVDLVAEVPSLEHEPELVLIHVETEQKYLDTIDERMWLYGMRLMGNSNKAVVSIVVFLTGGPEGMEERFVCKRAGPLDQGIFRYLAFGLSQSLAEEFVDRPEPLAAALAALMSSSVWDAVEKKLRCLEAIGRSPEVEPGGRYLLATVVETYVELSPADQERFNAELARESHKEVKKMVVTWEEALAERETIGEARGRAEGEAKGLIQGKIAAAQDAVVISGRRRFVDFPPAIEEKIRAIHDVDRLYTLLGQILTVEKLESLEL